MRRIAARTAEDDEPLPPTAQLVVVFAMKLLKRGACRIAGDRQRHRRREIRSGLIETRTHRTGRTCEPPRHSSRHDILLHQHHGKPARDGSPHGRRAGSTAESYHGGHVFLFKIPARRQVAGDIIGDKANRMQRAFRRRLRRQLRVTKSGRPNHMPIARPAAADERDHRMRHSLGKLSRDGQPGIELSPRAATGEHNVRWARHVNSEGE